MDPVKYIQHRYLHHPKLPLSGLEFLKKELKLGRKHVVANLDRHAFAISHVLLKHVHLVCHLYRAQENRRAIQTAFNEDSHLVLFEGQANASKLDNDAIDCIILGTNLEDYDVESLQEECKRIARLNSFVLLISHSIVVESSPFAQAYLAFLAQYSSTGKEEYSYQATENSLSKFYFNNYDQRHFSNQQRFDLEGISAYYLSSKGALSPEHSKYTLALETLKALFYQYQIGGQVHLEYQTKIYFGLFNKYVPAISLRKSLFFNLLRPFAFGFYVLVKMNIYFWKGVHLLKQRVGPKKQTKEK